MNVYEKLMEIQYKLKAPKSQFNSFGKYSYRSCEDILEGLKPLLTEVKAIVTLSDTIKLIGERYYVESTVTFIDVEKGESIVKTAFAREENEKKGMDASQITGSVSSYARKYALNGMFCIDDTKDSDATNTHDKDAPKTSQSAVGQEQTQGGTNTQGNKNKPTDDILQCADCHSLINKAVHDYSVRYYKTQLCPDCQKKHKKVS